uniref:Uncharacterized protein n=1 Tax=Anguilla anguilla TaxID=7936 RepID=A0A0E9RYA2_ANGAN
MYFHLFYLNRSCYFYTGSCFSSLHFFALCHRQLFTPSCRTVEAVVSDIYDL